MDSENTWTYHPTVHHIYFALAVCIRIQGLQNTPKRNTKNFRPLRTAIHEALDHFQQSYPSHSIPGMVILEKLISLPLFTDDYAEDISNNFQNSILHLGERVCGDEKLFRYTGKSRNIRLVPSKPGKIGLWFYELCVPLKYGGQFLLHTHLHPGGETLHVSEVVKMWIKVLKKYPDDSTLITMDSYYLDNTAKAVLDASNVKYLATFSSGTFSTVENYLKGKVHRPGDWYGVYNKNTNDSIVYNWFDDDKLGKRWVMSNACELQRGTSINAICPLVGLYNVTFNVCDEYNLALLDRSWPHRKGGHNRFGEKGMIHNFFLTCILMNTFNAFFQTQKINYSNFDFKAQCLKLSDELCTHVVSN